MTCRTCSVTSYLFRHRLEKFVCPDVYDFGTSYCDDTKQIVRQEDFGVLTLKHNQNEYAFKHESELEENQNIYVNQNEFISDETDKNPDPASGHINYVNVPFYSKIKK